MINSTKLQDFHNIISTFQLNAEKLFEIQGITQWVADFHKYVNQTGSGAAIDAMSQIENGESLSKAQCDSVYALAIQFEIDCPINEDHNR